MKLSAKKMGSMKALKESLKKGGSGGNFKNYIKNIPADGIVIRFLTEPEEWFLYREYWDDTAKTFVPMVEGEVLPDGAKPSSRYLANALDVDNDRVIPLKLAKTAANVLIMKYDKYDTMMDRNYELQKHGEGLDTTYDVTPDAPSKMNLAKYDLLDLDEVLANARAEATGETVDEVEDEEIVPKPTAKKKSPEPVSAGSAEDDDEDEDEDEGSEQEHEYADGEEAKLFPDGEFRTDYSKAELASMSGLDLMSLAGWWQEDGYTINLDGGVNSDTIPSILEAQKEYNLSADDESDEDEEEADETDDAEPEDEDGDEDEYSEEDLRAMSLPELRMIAEDLGVDVPRGIKKDALVDLIIEAAED